MDMGIQNYTGITVRGVLAGYIYKLDLLASLLEGQQCHIYPSLIWHIYISSIFVLLFL